MSIYHITQDQWIESQRQAGQIRYRWRCGCTEPGSWSVRRSTTSINTSLAALEQHCEMVHPALLVDWDKVFQGTYVASVALATDYFADAALEQEKKGMSRLSDIQARMRELEKEAAKYERFEKSDPYPAGTVITYDYQPIGVDSLYTYAVLKAGNGLWYWTGAQGGTRRGHDYDALVDSLADENVQNIRVAFPDDFTPLFQTLEERVGPEIAAKAEQGLKDIEDGKGVYMVRPEKNS
jgi:hypothetical protein